MAEKYIFSGHETFHCRQFWLKKGVDFLNDNRQFSDPNAVVALGVGKNMVSSINHWTKVFGIQNEEGSNPLTLFGERIFGATGGEKEALDPYLEDPNTLWLLQYKLFHSPKASIVKLILSDYRKEKVDREFTSSQLLQFVDKKRKANGTHTTENTIKNDIKVFIRNYVAPKRNAKTLEDDYSSLFIGLNIIEDIPDYRKDGEQVYRILLEDRKDIDYRIFAYLLLDAFTHQSSISFEDICEEVGAPLACHADGVEMHLEKIAEKYKACTFKSDAGRKEFQINWSKMKNKEELLESYYG